MLAAAFLVCGAGCSAPGRAGGGSGGGTVEAGSVLPGSSLSSRRALPKLAKLRSVRPADRKLAERRGGGVVFRFAGGLVPGYHVSVFPGEGPDAGGRRVEVALSLLEMPPKLARNRRVQPRFPEGGPVRFSSVHSPSPENGRWVFWFRGEGGIAVEENRAAGTLALLGAR